MNGAVGLSLEHLTVNSHVADTCKSESCHPSNRAVTSVFPEDFTLYSCVLGH